MESRTRRTLLIALPVGILIGAAGALAADPYLDEADSHVDKAIKALRKAYSPNIKNEFGGHGKKAIDLLEETKRQIKQAKEYDDSHQGKPSHEPKPDAGTTPTPKPTTDPNPPPKPTTDPTGGPNKPPPTPSGGPSKPPVPGPSPKKK